MGICVKEGRGGSQNLDKPGGGSKERVFRRNDLNLSL
jgi:hypothetical protein